MKNSTDTIFGVAKTKLIGMIAGERVGQVVKPGIS